MLAMLSKFQISCHCCQMIVRLSVNFPTKMNHTDEKNLKEQTENFVTRTVPTRRRSSIFSTLNNKDQDISSNCVDQVDSPTPCDEEYKKSYEEYYDHLTTVVSKTESREIFKDIDGIPLKERLKNVKLDPHRQAVLDEADQILREYTAAATELITRNEIRKEELKYRINRMKGFISTIQPK